MLLPIPEYDCLVPGLGMYAQHHESNPLVGGVGAEALLEEHVRFYFEREMSENPELNLAPGMHFPIIIGKMRERKSMQLQKPRGMQERFIAVQDGCRLLLVALIETASQGMYLLQLAVSVIREEEPNIPIMMPLITLHRYIKSN